MPVPILAVTHHWHCPRCGVVDTTNEAQPHTRFHPCPSLGGFTAPMAQGLKPAKLTVTEREDYVGTEDVAMVNGRPVMNITTEYQDGRTDVAVYAPTAHAGGSA